MSTSSYSATDAARRVRYRRRQEEKRQQQQPLLRASSASPTMMMTSMNSPPTSPPHSKSTTTSQQHPTRNNWNQRRNRIPVISPVTPASPSRSWDEGDTRPPSPGGGGKAWLRATTTASKQGGSIFRRVKSSPGVVETPPRTPDEEDLDEQSSVASSRRSSSGDAADETSIAAPFLPTPSPVSWDSRFVEVQEKAMLQQRDNTRSLRTIQQLLANVQAERDQALNKLDVLRQQRADSPLNDSSATTIIAEESAAKHKAMADRITALEKELRAVAPSCRLLTQDVDWKNKEIVPEMDEEVVRRAGSECDSIETSPSLVSTTNSSNHAQFDLLRKDLQEKTTALENAKMIIASLEKSSGSQTTELKTKVRQKEEEIQRLKKDATEKQKTLDALAIDLRDVQRKPHGAPTQAESIKRVQLSSRLEANLSDIQAAAVVIECTQDPGAVSNLSELLSDSVNALRDGIGAIENGVPEHPSGRSFNLWRELEEKKKAVRNLEQSLMRQEENFRHLRKQRDASQAKLENENEALHTEVRILRQQCITNMEVLTKKERELVVLRDSLKVEDDVGYISDDEEETDDGEMSSATPAADTNMVLKSEYGHSQTEALATLLATGGNRSFDSNSVGPTVITNDQIVKQLSTLKTELAKTRSENEKTKRQLQVEKESLSNAKMIISSLERANKKMMEDLRARLQDSNSAIASLLEKSLDSEKTNSKLRSEIEGLKRERIGAPDEGEPLLAIPPPPAMMELEETID